MGHSMADYYMTTPRFYCMLCGATMIDEGGNVLKNGSQFIKDTSVQMIVLTSPVIERQSIMVCKDCYKTALEKGFSPHLYWNEDGIIHAY